MIIDDPNPKGLVRGSDAWKLFRSPRWYPTIAAAEDPASSTRSSCHHIQLLVDVHFHLSFNMAKYSRWTKRSILDQHGLQKISAWLCSGHQAKRSLFDDLDQWYRRNGKWRYETVAFSVHLQWTKKMPMSSSYGDPSVIYYHLWALCDLAT